VNSDLRDLYQEVVLDHSRKPRNFGKLEGANRSAEGFNPLCGDRVTVYVKLQQGAIEDIRFEGSGCAISKASASLMTGALKGKRMEDAEKLFQEFHLLVTEGPNEKTDPADLGKLVALSGVWEFPARVKCATLAWHTMKSALSDGGATVTTEDPATV
jgi:nitrogen fixation NifU-like protein